MKESIINEYTAALEEFCSYHALEVYPEALDPGEAIFVLGIGKAAWQMAKVLCAALQKRNVEYSGIVLTKYHHSQAAIPGMSILEAGHPLPDESSILHTETILRVLGGLAPDTRLVVLLSGGGSALFEKPLGLSLQELRSQSLPLQNSGIGIEELNQWRIQHSAVKGGKALSYIPCHKIEVLLLSDIKDNPPDLIASAPFYGTNMVNGRLVEHRILADNLAFRKLFAERLRSTGLRVHLDEEFYELKAEAMAEHLYSRIEAWDQEPGVMLLGGECPVTVKGAGKGGRCTHLALLMAERMVGKKGFSFLALATDGTDGPTDAAGAWVDSDTATQCDIRQAIRDCDSYKALERVGALIKTGASGTNVNDVFVIVKRGCRVERVERVEEVERV